MSISMYQLSIPVFSRALDNLSNILNKAAAHAERRKIAPSVMLSLRLFPDMYPLSKQIQIVTDLCNGGGARLAGIERPVHEDTETSFEQLQARIEKTLQFLKSIKPEQVDGSEEKPITLTIGGNELQFTGLPYLQHFVLPNLYFHSATAYGILRHGGVEIGKSDFMGGK